MIHIDALCIKIGYFHDVIERKNSRQEGQYNQGPSGYLSIVDPLPLEWLHNGA